MAATGRSEADLLNEALQLLALRVLRQSELANSEGESGIAEM
jgi:hypothetical protein